MQRFTQAFDSSVVFYGTGISWKNTQTSSPDHQRCKAVILPAVPPLVDNGLPLDYMGTTNTIDS